MTLHWAQGLAFKIANMVPFILALTVFGLLLWLTIPTRIDTRQFASRTVVPADGSARRIPERPFQSGTRGRAGQGLVQPPAPTVDGYERPNRLDDSERPGPL
jgi:hypothetical protein